VWYPNIAELNTEFRVYAVDTIGDAGKSMANRLLTKRADYAHWLQDVFDGLGLEQVNLLGHSYGGWMALNMALTHSHRVRRLVLLAPGATLCPLSFLTMLFFKLGELNIRPSARSTFNMMKAKGTVLKDAFIHHMEMVNRYCKPAIIYPDVYTDNELRQISMPTLLLLGANDKIYNPRKAMQRAKRLMPNLTGEIIPGLGHILFMDQPELIDARILKFLRVDN
jgi:pimeloyl-ACP methyl ester carboxylesterase